MRYLVFLSALLASFYLLPSPAEAGGPLRVSNAHPLFYAAGNPALQPVALQNSAGVYFAYSSVFLMEEAEEWAALLDMEVALLELDVRKTLGEKTEVGLTVPVLSYNSGFMDGFLGSFHDLLGVGNYGREQRNDDEFGLALSREGETLVAGESGGVGLGDIRLGVKRALLPYAGAYAFVDLPTGDAERGYGNGSPDFGAALLLGGELGEGLDLYFNAGFVVPGDYRGAETFELENYLYGGGGLGWAYSENLTLNAQLMAKGSPFTTGIRELDTEALVLSLGGGYALGGASSLEAAFSEDLNTAGAPDFMLAVGYRRALSGD